MKFISKSEKQTINFAKKFAKTLKGSDVLGLIGDLGTGKTVFAKGLAEVLGIECAHSPTFVLMHLHKIKNQRSKIKSQGLRIKFLCHIDAYRLSDAEALLEIGADEYIGNPEVITVIEWAEKVKKILPKKTKWIKFEHYPKKENWRIIKYNSPSPLLRGK